MIQERKAWQGVIALFAVIALAIGASFSSLWSGISIGTHLWTICNIISALTQWAMPSMVTIIGSIFLASNKRIGLKTLWKRYIPYAAISAIFWWLAASAVWMQSNHPQELDFLTFRECMAEVLDSPANIGFCHMLITFFVLYPLLSRIAENQKLTVYGIVLFYVMSLVESVFKYIPYLSALALFTDQLNWGYYRAWTFYLLLGVWITKYDHSWKLCLALYVAGIVATGSMVALTSITTSISYGYANEYIGYTSPLTGLQTIAITLFIKRVCSNMHTPAFTRSTRNLWYCVPVLFVSSIFSDRLIVGLSDDVLVNAIAACSANIIVATVIVILFGFLPGFRFLVGDYSNRGASCMM